MGIMTRRNALVGWLVLTIARRKARQKAAGVVPIEPPSPRLTKRRLALVAAASAFAVGVTVYLRKRAARPAPPEPPEQEDPAPEPDSPAGS